MINVSCRNQFSRPMGSITQHFQNLYAALCFSIILSGSILSAGFLDCICKILATLATFCYLFTNSYLIKYNCSEEYIQSNSNFVNAY